MKRSFFAASFVRIALATSTMVVVAVLWSGRRSLGVVALAAALWVVLSASIALALSRMLQSGLASLQERAERIPDAQPAIEDFEEPIYSDLDGLAGAIAGASTKTHAALLRAAERRSDLEGLLDSMQDAVVAVDAAGRIQWTNEAMQRLMAAGSTQSVVRVGHALVETVRDPEVLDCVKSALEERTVCERRTTTMSPGSIFEVNASPMPGGGAVAVLHDITRIEQVERAQRDFVANVSHELRTPLTSISGYVETLLDHEELSPVAREFLSTILKNSTRMNRLTEDLLTMARVESQETKMQPASVRADALVRDAVKAMLGMVKEEAAELEIGETTQAMVYVDTDSMLQVLGNLIENGIKYGRGRGLGQSRVVVSAREVSSGVGEGEAVEFSVRDFGQGIASEHLGRIFERFYRVDKARSRESGGTGLGLAIARHMVEAQGGKIRAESELNAGSTFLVVLPKATPEALAAR